MTTRTRLGSRGVTFTAVALAAAIVVAVARGATYPSTPFDFAHPGAPHDTRLTPAGGTNDRPLLVVVTQFPDEDQPTTTSRAAIDAKFFGDGGVTDYFRKSSFGKLTFSRASESDGVANDGIVHVDMAPTTYQTWAGTTEATRHQLLLQKADPKVDFAVFDRNGDNNVTEDELAIVEVQETRPENFNCAGARPVAAGTVLDGKSITGGNSRVAFGASSVNKITYIHELGHEALGELDHSYVTGRLDLMGPTCSSTEWSWDHNAWHKLHLGWVVPTVVVKDGYYDVGEWHATGQTYLLYDPDRGTNDYFLVENRTAKAGSLDEDASDRGLVIWRVEDTRFGQVAPRTPYVLVTPSGPQTMANYGGGSTDAWNPSDPSTPQDAMTADWADGTPSKLAVRAIGAAGDTVRAYFDVRGPGVLVDPSAAVQNVTMLQANPVSFPVLNTGEATDTFAFTLTGLPAGWTATTQTQSLAACSGDCTSGTATVQLTVPGNTPIGDYTLQAKGTSTTDAAVTSTSPVTVRVRKRATTLVYNGATTGDYSDPAALSAVVTDSATGQPLAGKPVLFVIGTQTPATIPTTGSTGVATSSLTLSQPSGSVQVSASFDGDGTYLASIDTDAFAITKETLSLAYTGSTLVALGSTPILSSTATEEPDGSPGDLTLAEAVFSLTPTLTTAPFSYTTGVGPTGLSTITATGLPVDIWSVTVAVPAGNRYWEGPTAAGGELVLFDPAAKFTGDAAGRDSAGAPIAVTFAARYDSRLRPRGAVTVRFSGGTFTAKDPLWIVHVGNVAVFEDVGTLNGSTARLRLRVDDNAEPARPDTFRARIGAYDSGTTAVTSGNLQSHPT